MSPSFHRAGFYTLLLTMNAFGGLAALSDLHGFTHVAWFTAGAALWALVSAMMTELTGQGSQRGQPLKPERWVTWTESVRRPWYWRWGHYMCGGCCKAEFLNYHLRNAHDLRFHPVGDEVSLSPARRSARYTWLVVRGWWMFVTGTLWRWVFVGP